MVGGHGVDARQRWRYTGHVSKRATRARPRGSRSARPASTNRTVLVSLVEVTEDDADGIISTQRLKKERRYSLDRVLRENGCSLEG